MNLNKTVLWLIVAIALVLSAGALLAGTSISDTVEAQVKHLWFGDNVEARFGDAAGGDANVKWDGSQLLCTSAATKFSGDVIIGGGTAGHAQNGGDLYVTDQVEVDGACYLDAAVTVGTSLTMTYATASTAPFINSSKALVTGAFSLASGANTACATTCTASKVCLFGFDDGAADAETVVACDDAAADKCVCLGAAS